MNGLKVYALSFNLKVSHKVEYTGMAMLYNTIDG